MRSSRARMGGAEGWRGPLPVRFPWRPTVLGTAAAVLTGIWYLRRGWEADDVPPQRSPVTFVSLLRDRRWWFVHQSSANLPSLTES